MPIAFVAASSAKGTSDAQSSLSVSHTNNGNCVVLIASHNAIGFTGASAGVAMSYGGSSATVVGFARSSNANLAIGYKIGAATGANLAEVVWSSASIVNLGLHVLSYSGVSLANPIAATAASTGTSSSPSVTISSGEMKVGGIYHGVSSLASTGNSSITARTDVAPHTSFHRSVSADQASTASINMSWSAPNANWAALAISLKAAAVSGGANLFSFF